MHSVFFDNIDTWKGHFIMVQSSLTIRKNCTPAEGSMQNPWALIKHDLNVRRNLEFWESRGALSTQLADFLRWLKIVFCVGRRCATCCDPAAWQSRPHNNAPQRSPILIIICLYTKKQICNLRPSCKSKRYFDNLVAAFVSQSMSAIFFASELSKRSVSNSGNALCSLKSLHRAIAGFIFD